MWGAPGRGGLCVTALAACVLFVTAIAAASSTGFRPPKLPQRLAVARVWAVGDGANGSAQAKAVGRRIASSRADLFLYLGDVYPDGTAADFANGYATTYGALAPITA